MESLTDLADEWLLTLGTVSEETRKVYARGVEQFAAWLADTHPDVVDPGQIVRRHVDGWMRALTEAGRSEATRRVRLITIRKFFGYLVTEPDIAMTDNPAERVEVPTAKVKAVPVIHDDDLVRLLRPIEAGASFTDRRDAAMIRVLLECGCRRAELGGIDVADVDLRAQEITLRRTKGGNERIVPIGAKTALSLRKYLRARGKHAAAGSAPLFLSIRMGDRGGFRISGDGIARVLERRCAAAGLAMINPHRFRHSWAHDLLAHGAASPTWNASPGGAAR